MVRLHLLFEHDGDGNPHGCSHIRLLRPFAHPSVAGALAVTKGTALPDRTVDVVVVERSWKPDFSLAGVEQLVNAVRRQGARLIYTLDDNLLDLHEDAPWEPYPTSQQRVAMRHLAREADEVLVSTVALAHRLSRLNKNVSVVPNALDEQLFPACGSLPPSAGGKFKIGYMGTRTHAADLLMILAPLRDFLRRHETEVELELVGVFADARVAKCLDDYPMRVLEVGDSVGYDKFIPWAARHLHWDFALAPLHDSPINDCKSDIKFLDYAMLGIPAIFSAVSPYTDSVVHGETGWLCANHAEDWSAALERMFADTASRTAMARKAKAHVSANRTLMRCAVQWLEVVNRVANRRAFQC